MEAEELGNIPEVEINESERVVQEKLWIKRCKQQLDEILALARTQADGNQAELVEKGIAYYSVLLFYLFTTYC